MSFLNFLRVFFQIGAFTYGGGLAMIPILRNVVIDYSWLTDAQFADLIAISQSTPGPIAINMATYIGYREFGAHGAVWASIAIILPSFILAIALGKFLKKYNKERGVKAAFVGVKAAIIGLIGTSVVQIALVSLYGDERGKLLKPLIGLDVKAVLMLGAFFYAIRKTQKHPIVYVLIAGVLGVFIWN